MVYSHEWYLISDNVISVNGTIIDKLDKSGSINLFLYNINTGDKYFIYGDCDGVITDMRDRQMVILQGTYGIEAIAYTDGWNNRADIAFRNINATTKKIPQHATQRDFLLDMNAISTHSSGIRALQEDQKYFDDGGS